MTHVSEDQISLNHNPNCSIWQLVDEMNAHKKGLHFVELTHIPTMKTWIMGLVYRKSAKDNGLTLNFCPLCGEPLRDLSGDGKNVDPVQYPDTFASKIWNLWKHENPNIPLPKLE